ncbi:hypothetical protein RPMA_18600 [Tardiphaga alba]|uniref:Uncharacterized protein n=1 Tax=Tardiphaga alba TaxID=340268 RepID=A0ABX8AAE1_9BRAD|nr:hypothetical protein RPMA_18600 [Tardiphaga alba]
MLKTFSAALIAVSVLAAPAFAGGFGPARHAHRHHHALDARAQMIHRHHDHRLDRYHRHVRPHFHFHRKLGRH